MLKRNTEIAIVKKNWYEEAVLYAKDAGFRDIYIFNGEEFKKESI